MDARLARLGLKVKKPSSRDEYRIVALYHRGIIPMACLDRAAGPKLKEPVLADVTILEVIAENQQEADG